MCHVQSAIMHKLLRAEGLRCVQHRLNSTEQVQAKAGTLVEVSLRCAAALVHLYLVCDSCHAVPTAHELCQQVQGIVDSDGACSRTRETAPSTPALLPLLPLGEVLRVSQAVTHNPHQSRRSWPLATTLRPYLLVLLHCFRVCCCLEQMQP